MSNGFLTGDLPTKQGHNLYGVLGLFRNYTLEQQHIKPQGGSNRYFDFLLFAILQTKNLLLNFLNYLEVFLSNIFEMFKCRIKLFL